MSDERKSPYFYRYWKKSTNKKPEHVGGDALAFTPKNELNVREVFAERAGRLGYRILESRIPFPDYILAIGSRRILAEAEFKTSDFLRHKHDISRCDLIVVWEHDLPYMPVPVYAGARPGAEERGDASAETWAASERPACPLT
jgi:hypothetical protein